MFLKVKPPDMTDWHNGSRVPQLGLSLHTVLDGLMLCIFTILKVSVSVLYFSDTNLKKKTFTLFIDAAEKFISSYVQLHESILLWL